MNVYQIVTDRIICQLAEGTIPWKKSWISVHEGAFNRISKKSYSILNQMLARFAPDMPIAPFGSEDYSKEELVAELGSAAILNTLGLETTSTFQGSAAYIKGWLSVLNDDNRFIVSASAKADKAVRMILGREAA